MCEEFETWKTAAESLPPICKHFESKWGCQDPDKLSQLEAFCERHGCMQGRWDDEDIKSALTRLRPKPFLSADGTCVLAWKHVQKHKPNFVTECINHLACSPQQLQKLSIDAKIWGKKTRKPKLSEIRMILPLSPLLSILDVLVSEALSAWLSRVSPPLKGIFVGGERGTQPQDISCACSMWLEKGHDAWPDDHTVAQADIEKYYDSLDPVHIAESLLCGTRSPGDAIVMPAPTPTASGTRLPGDALAVATPHGAQFPGDVCAEREREEMKWQSITAAAVMLMLCTGVKVGLDGKSQSLMKRASGTLTGSRTAGALGKIVVVDTMLAAIASKKITPVKISNKHLCFASWVDNIYSFGTCQTAARRNIDIFGETNAAWI